LVLFGGLVATVSGQVSPGKSATPAKLPALVDAAFKRAYPQAAITNVIHETEDGIEQYEIESIANGLRLDVVRR
jgi:hypothetical protein